MDFKLNIDNCIIEVVDTVKTLGVFFNKNMSWDHHISSMLTNLSKCVGMLAKFRSYLPISVKLIIYNTLFLSYVKYCFLVWGTTTRTNLQKIFILQKKAVRLIANVDYLAHTQELFKRFHIVPIHKLYEVSLAARYKKSISHSDHTFLQLSSLRLNSAPYSFRKPDHWNIPFCRTDHGRQMLRHTVPRLLNKLISENISIETSNLRALREYILEASVFHLY